MTTISSVFPNPLRGQTPLRDSSAAAWIARCVAVTWGLLLAGSAAVAAPNAGILNLISFGCVARPAAALVSSTTPVRDTVVNPATDRASTGINAATSPVFKAIPEPQTWVVGLCGVTTLLALQRFRRGRTTRRP